MDYPIHCKGAMNGVPKSTKQQQVLRLRTPLSARRASLRMTVGWEGRSLPRTITHPCRKERGMNGAARRVGVPGN